MVFASQLAYYPKTRGGRLPASPMMFIEGQFAKLFSSPRRIAIYRKAFADSVAMTREIMGKAGFGVNRGRSFLEAKADFIQKMEKTVRGNDFSARTWYRLAHGGLTLIPAGPFVDISSQVNCSGVERNIIGKLSNYLGHDIAHTSPRAVLAYALENLIKVLGAETEFDIPDYARGHFINFSQGIRQYFEYFEGQMEIGEAFFTPRSELSALRQIKGDQLEAFCKLIANAFALRFLGAYFDVATQEGQTRSQNSLAINIDPDLTDVRLPLYLIGPKIVGDIKNCLRIVENRQKASCSLSLAKMGRAEEIEDPVGIEINARRLNDRCWELRICDNGRGIIVEELFQPLANACQNLPGAVSPAIEQAVKRWNTGDPFAFNHIPLEDLFQAVYHLGVSTGTGEKGSGLGLWGSLLLLFKLGAKLRVGVTPRTGGFYQSVVLPVNLKVLPQEVERSAKALWQNYV